MDNINRYTAEEVARMLKSVGFKISKRVVNYLAFEKNMFELKVSGKKCFTDDEVDKIQAILLLQSRTELSMEEIKHLINTQSLEEIKRKYRHEPQYKSFVTGKIKQTIDLMIHDNHIILLLENKKVLLDTGATQSIGHHPFIFLGEKQDLKQTFMGVGIDEISELLKLEIDVVLGGDILKDCYFIIDLVEEKATFSKAPLDFIGQVLPVEVVMNIPVAEIEIEGQKRRVFIDTSAKISYFKEELVHRYPVFAKEQHDFYPGIGTFMTDVYEVPGKLGESHISLRFGILPESLEKVLMFAGCEGIMGFDLFRHYGAAYFNLGGKLIILEKRASPLP